MMKINLICSMPYLASVVFLMLASGSNGFLLSPLRPVGSHVASRMATHFMISFGQSDTTELPRDVKEAVSRCRAAVQEALKNRLSRMDIEMPVGTKFGVEKTSRKKRSSDDGAPTKDVLDTSDRELARLFVEMFQPVGGENIAVVFRDQNLADVAKKQWKGDYGASSRIMAVNRKASSSNKKKKKAMGFAAKIAAEVEASAPGGPFKLPDTCEVAIFVAPGPKELLVVDKTCREVGMGTLVILLNARLANVQNYGTDAARTLFTEEFESVFQLCAAPQEEAPGCLLYRSYPSDWVLARKPKIGKPKSFLCQPSRPTPNECRRAYESLEIGEVERNVESMMDNVAGWLS